MELRAVVFVVGVLAAVLAQPATAQVCPAPKVSAMRISLSSIQNKTGHWDSKVSFKQGEPGSGHVWLADLDQNIVQCDEKEAVLETVLHLKASPSSSAQASSGSHWMPPWYNPNPPPTPCPTRTPPAGYELFPGVGHYKFHPEKVTWPVARKACTAEGGHLVILNSEKENDVIKQIFARHPEAGNWFSAGILEFGVHAEWFTLFGEPLETTGFTRIVLGENNEMGPSDFGVINRNGAYGDGQISWNFPFLCEFDL